jgi:hypothetical protein
MRQPETVLTQSGQASKPAARWIKAVVTSALATGGTIQHDGNRAKGEFCQELMFPDGKAEQDALYAFKTCTDLDTMYLHQAMKEGAVPGGYDQGGEGSNGK